MAKSVAGLNFIIVGASISGLASAIALKASGHNVLVLEKEPQLGRTGSRSGCARVPPNGCKILFDWGLEEETKASAEIAGVFTVYKYDGGNANAPDFIGLNQFEPNLLSEARGHFVQFRHQDLVHILYDKLTKREEESTPRVVVVFGAEVVEIDCDACTVTTRSGETHTGDAVLGADGVCGVVRRTLMVEEGVEPSAFKNPTGLTMYSGTIPMSLIANDPDLAMFYQYPKNTVLMGSNRGALTNVAGTQNDIALVVYTPDNAEDGSWAEDSERQVTDIIGPCAPQLQKLASLAGPPICVQIQDHYELESWVSESGRVLVLGEAAHPFPAAALHAYSIALEDGAFIGKIFSHTRNRDRIPEFLYAFQEHRGQRCARIREMEKQIIGTITLPDGEMQLKRDAAMRASHAMGRNVMDAPDSDLQDMHDDMRMIFGYEPEDDADEWWMTWGRFRDSETAAEQNNFIKWDFSRLTSHENHDSHS
ncbi:hypothetical protein B0H11DRAFT_2072946 [Mycena galericulata]|nr:hypothetical protein B0H11DRAFT_2072946 [Mycena galericulata]